VSIVYLVQHAEKERTPGDPGLTSLGRDTAARTGEWFGGVGVDALYCSPLLRARQTAQHIGRATGLEAQQDDRLRERMNWDGAQPLEEFLTDWARCTADRGYVPRVGDSSRRAGDRLLSFVAEHADGPGRIVAVTHGGVTVDFLRTLVGDDQLPAGLIAEGVPGCALTVLDGLTVVRIATTDHLAAEAGEARPAPAGE